MISNYLIYKKHFLKMKPKWTDMPVIIFSGRGSQDAVEKVINPASAVTNRKN
jgi:hypothetical protein